MPLDPGPHHVELRDANDKATFSAPINLAEGGAEHVAIPLGDADATPEPAPLPSSPPPPAAPAAPQSSSSRLPATLMWTGGAVLLVGSGVLYGLRESSLHSVEASCTAPKPPKTAYTNCPLSSQATSKLIPLYEVGSGAALGTGVAAVAVESILCFVLGPSKAPVSSGVSVVPTGRGIDVAGRF